MPFALATVVSSQSPCASALTMEQKVARNEYNLYGWEQDKLMATEELH
jgi:hypothetical protein